MNWIIRQFKKKTWSPYAAGVFLGLVNVLALVMTENPMGVSSAFNRFVGMLLKAFSADSVNSLFYKHVMPPGINYTVIIFVGIIIGAFISAKAGGDFRIRKVTDHQWIERFGQAPWKRWVVAFLGGIIIEYASNLAGGCTSGLAISGTMMLAPAGFIFIAGLFASGIVTAFLIYGKRKI